VHSEDQANLIRFLLDKARTCIMMYVRNSVTDQDKVAEWRVCNVFSQKKNMRFFIVSTMHGDQFRIYICPQQFRARKLYSLSLSEYTFQCPIIRSQISNFQSLLITNRREQRSPWKNLGAVIFDSLYCRCF